MTAEDNIEREWNILISIWTALPSTMATGTGSDFLMPCRVLAQEKQFQQFFLFGFISHLAILQLCWRLPYAKPKPTVARSSASLLLLSLPAPWLANPNQNRARGSQLWGTVVCVRIARGARDGSRQNGVACCHEMFGNHFVFLF